MSVRGDFIQGEHMDIILCFRERRGTLDRFWAGVVGEDPTTPDGRKTLRLYWGAIHFSLFAVDCSLVNHGDFIRRAPTEPRVIHPENVKSPQLLCPLHTEAKWRLEQKKKQGYIPVQFLEDSLQQRVKLATACFQYLKFCGETPPEPLALSAEKAGPAESRKENTGRWKPDAGFIWF